MHTFVGQILKQFYTTPQDVTSDPELSAFTEDLHQNGFKGHDFPAAVKTLDELTSIVTALLYNSTAAHAAYNYSQFDGYGTNRNHRPRSKI